MVIPRTSQPPPYEGLRAALVEAGHAALLGESLALREALRAADLAAATAVTLLVQGEPGSGVEAFARLVHALSPRAPRPFVAVDCTTLIDATDDALLEKIALVDGGTLFLDEVDALSPAAQALVHRALSAPLGGRVVAGTHADLREAARRGSFRDDLAATLGEVTLAVPPLRERADDVAALASHFAALASERLGRRVTLPRTTLTAMQAHRWPRNLPELQDMVDRLVASADDPVASHADDYRVPVRRELVTLTLADGARCEATLFCLPDQSPDGLFDRAERFVPVERDGRVRLYAIDAIACVSAVVSGASIDGDALVVARAVCVRLRSGASIEGEVRYVATSARGRAVDFLNDDARSFAVHAGDVVHFVAKAHVEHVEER